MLTLEKEIEAILLQEKNGMHVNAVTNKLVLAGVLTGDLESAIRKTNAKLSALAKKSSSPIQRVSNGKGGYKRGYYRIRQTRAIREKSAKPVQVIKPFERNLFSDISTNMIGKAGEYAVVSKLLLNGYVANIMSVDEGIDIIASKDQNVYFIQVKTATVAQNLTCKFSIKKSSFQKGHLLDIRYILVARHGDNNLLFIKLAENEIERLERLGLLSADNNTYNVKVRFSGSDALIYNGDKSESLMYYKDNFNL